MEESEKDPHISASFYPERTPDSSPTSVIFHPMGPSVTNFQYLSFLTCEESNRITCSAFLQGGRVRQRASWQEGALGVPSAVTPGGCP